MSKRAGPAPQRAGRPARAALARILTVCPEAFVEVDATGVVTEWNPKAEATFGWRRDEVVGQRVEETVLAPRLDGAALGHLGGPAGLLGHAKGGGGNGDGTSARRCLLELVTGSGERTPVEALVFAVDEASDCSYGGVAAFLRRLDSLPAPRPAASPR
ncbi:MAG TPA: PAS domain S-box protein, partial [Acidimicrobiales bacterium]|nr:PAS domain S-box protein [Acidimicrobiales bacterium]